MSLVSIGMPVRNGEATLGYAVASIVLQTHQDWELLLMDDGSTDASTDVAARFADPRIRVVSDGRRLGLASRMNQAMATARGRYFARMDADDISYPGRLATQIAFLESHPQIDLVGTWAVVFRDLGQPRGVRRPPIGHDEICSRPWDGFPMIHPTYFALTEVFRRVGYRTAFQRSQDQDFLLRLAGSGRIANIPEYLLGYREERVRLGNVLRSRLYFLRALTDRAAAERRTTLALRGYGRAMLKSVGTVVACTTGLQHHLLRHRARAIPEGERERWGEVWRSVAQLVAEVAP